MTLAGFVKKLREKVLQNPEITNMPLFIAGTDDHGELTFLHEGVHIWIGKHRIVLEGVKKEVK